MGVIRLFVCARATLDRRIRLGEKTPVAREFVGNAQVEAKLRACAQASSHGLSLQDFVALVQAGSVAELVNPPKSKTSTHASEVARRTTTLPLIFDLLATEPFSMRVLGPLLWLHDNVDSDLAETPAFRDIDGDCVIPGNLRLFLVTLAAETGIDVQNRGIGLH